MAEPKEIEHEEIDNRPQLPDLIPSSDVTVDGEEFTYEEFVIDSGTIEEYEYTLSKGPIYSIERITGIDRSGGARTFSNGTDYELVDEVKDQIESFTYSSNQSEYELVSPPDDGTLTVLDESGDNFVQGTDYEIINPDDAAADVIRWKEGGSTPNEQEAFSADYETTFPDSVVQWQTDANNRPQPGTEFYVTYHAPSIVSRYLDEHERKLDSVEEQVQGVIEGKFIESATGQELDEIGKLFGPLIGKRRGRTDDNYRTYLKSVVQSFISRGTVNGIKLAISAATGIDLDDIEIIEDFSVTGYEVVVVPSTPVGVGLLEEIAEIADPSGVALIRTRLDIPEDEMATDDGVSITLGELIDESMGIADTTNTTRGAATDSTGIGDSTAFDRTAKTDTTGIADTIASVRGATTDTMSAADALAIDPNTLTVADQLASDDTVALNPNKVTVDDTSGIADTAQVTIGQIGDLLWQPSDDGFENWNEAFWVKIEDLVRQTSDDAGIDDAGSLRPKAATTADSLGSNDSATEQVKAAIIADVSGSGDLVEVTFNSTNVTDESGIADASTQTEEAVAWDIADWNGTGFNWTIEHN